MKLKKITLVLENCECITIDGKYIGHFLVEDIRTSIRRTDCNSIDKIDVAYTFAIEIHKDANNLYSGFESKPIFDRLISYDDIVSIDFELSQNCVENGQPTIVEHYDYYVRWNCKSYEENEYQKSYISNVGNLYIVIADDKCIEDFFNREEIDDEAYMDFVCCMYDIGDKYSKKISK